MIFSIQWEIDVRIFDNGIGSDPLAPYSKPGFTFTTLRYAAVAAAYKTPTFNDSRRERKRKAHAYIGITCFRL
jgi:hypothetical protein